MRAFYIVKLFDIDINMRKTVTCQKVIEIDGKLKISGISLQIVFEIRAKEELKVIQDKNDLRNNNRKFDDQHWETTHSKPERIHESDVYKVRCSFIKTDV